MSGFIEIDNLLAMATNEKLKVICPVCGGALKPTGDVHTCNEFISPELKCTRCGRTWCEICMFQYYQKQR